VKKWLSAAYPMHAQLDLNPGPRWPIHADYSSLLKISICDVGSVCTGVVINMNEIRADCASVRANMDLKDFIEVPYYRQCTVFNDL
jgi:hypothetical protein